MDLSIVIVSWNVKDRLQANLQALYNSQGDFKFEIFVIDNNSADGSVAMVRELFPQVQLIVNSENLGFARANNQALKIAQGDFVLLLNPDMRVFPDTLEKMLGWMRSHPQATVASCQLVDGEGRNIPVVRRFPRLNDQLAIVLKWPHLFPRINDKYLATDFTYSQERVVDSIRGAFFMINRSTLESLYPDVKLFLDERYFIWFEEVDFCRQIQSAGGQVWYAPVTACVDYVGQSFNQVKRFTTQKYFRDSMLKYFLKWHPFYQYLILKLAWKIGLGLAKIWPEKSR